MRIPIAAVMLCSAALAGDQAPDAAVLSVQEKIAAAARSRVPAGSTNWIVVIKPGTPAVPVAQVATNATVKQSERRFPIAFGNFQVLTSFWDRASLLTPCVSGLVFNRSDYQYRFVSITIKLYSGDMVVGDAEAATAELAPGDAWLFKAPVLHDGVDRYVIARVEGSRYGQVKFLPTRPQDDLPARAPKWGVGKRQPDKNW